MSEVRWHFCNSYGSNNSEKLPTLCSSLDTGRSKWGLTQPSVFRGLNQKLQGTYRHCPVAQDSGRVFPAGRGHLSLEAVWTIQSWAGQGWGAPDGAVIRWPGLSRALPNHSGTSYTATLMGSISASMCHPFLLQWVFCWGLSAEDTRVELKSFIRTPLNVNKFMGDAICYV